MRWVALLVAATILGTAAPSAAAGPGGEEPLEDLTPPVITVTPSAGAVNGWYAGDASVFVKATDPGPISTGVRSVFYTLSGASAGSGSVHRTDGGTIPVSASGVTTITIEATDGNDNQSFAAPVVRIDRTSPTVEFTGRLAGQGLVFAQGEQVPVQYDCADGQSGISSCTGTKANGELLDTSQIGSFSITATARDWVGNQVSLAKGYQVVSNQFSVVRDVDMSGMEVVGRTMTALPPEFSPAPTRVDYQWTRNGVAIPGATGTTYTLTADDARTDLRVQATAVRSGWVNRVSTSASRRVFPAVFSVSPEPVLSGVATVGRGLVVQHGQISPTPATVGYQWFRDGVLIPDAASDALYILQAEDRGKRITARVVANAPGYAEGVWLTPASETVRGRPLVMDGLPTVAGSARVGSVLTATPPEVFEPVERDERAEDQLGLTYQWLRNGSPVSGATLARYRLTAADAGARMSVRVTAAGPAGEGYEPVSATSTPGAPVAKATPTVTAKAKTKRDRTVALTVRVAAPGTSPAGAVTVKRGGKVVARGKVPASGRLTLLLKRQPKGKVTWTVTYAGSPGVTARTVKVSATVR